MTSEKISWLDAMTANDTPPDVLNMEEAAIWRAGYLSGYETGLEDGFESGYNDGRYDART